jgi:hypothetical protein
MTFSDLVPRLRPALWLAAALLTGGPARAEIQFDLFAGHDGVVRSGGWYPVGIEVFNDGPSFEAVIELAPGAGGGVAQQLAIDLPTNTRKRLVVPSFSSSGGLVTFEARLRQKATGKVVKEANRAQLTHVAWEAFLLGAAPGSFGGMPAFPEIKKSNRPEFTPRVVRLGQGADLDFFPDNPIALESLNAIYLNSGRALALKEPQVEALVTWLHAGGHLIVAVDQPADVNATEWLRELLPARVQGVSARPLAGEFDRWLRRSPQAGRAGLRFGFEPPALPPAAANDGASNPGNPFQELTPDRAFDRAELPVAGLTPRNGEVLLATEGANPAPLLVAGRRGRGVATVLAFNPEKEPFRAWTLRPWFWAHVAGVAAETLRPAENGVWGGRGLDAVFGAMIDSRQVRKLPVGVLLLLLVVYLGVIGPLDQWWLRKLNRPMLTWLTFPAYVVLFSVLIYYIGFRLRAGSREWNELHVVDVLPRGGEAVLRGRSFVSLYSPANDTYRVATPLNRATLRTEFQGLWGNSADSGRVTLRAEAAGAGYEADLYVPVWSTQMNVADWVQGAALPLQARYDGDRLTLANRSGHDFAAVVVVRDGRWFEAGKLAADAETGVDLPADRPVLGEQMQTWRPQFDAAASRRDDLFGGNDKGEHIDDWAQGSMTASFGGLLTRLGNNQSRDFVWPAGLDLSPLTDRGDTVILAWVPDHLLVQPLNRFPAERQRRGTLLRLVLPPRPPQS